MDTSEGISLKPGVAYIKPEFLVIPPSNSNKGTSPTEPKSDDSTAGAAPTSNGDTATTAATKRSADESDGYHNKPAKQKRGQNKQRPRLKKEWRCNKLCRFLWAATEQDYKKAGLALPNSDASKHPNSDASVHPNGDASKHPNSDESKHPNSDASKHPNSDASKHPNSDASKQNGSNGNISASTAKVLLSESEKGEISSDSQGTEQKSPMPDKNVLEDVKLDDSSGSLSKCDANNEKSSVPVQCLVLEVDSDTKQSFNISTAAELPSARGKNPLCFHGSCTMSHDVASFLGNKPKDIGDKCHNFRTFGFCEYGVICRFGSEHIRNGCNIRNEELWKSGKQLSMVANILPKDTQNLLRKKNYVFHKAKAASRRAQKDKIRNKDAETGSTVVDAVKTPDTNVISTGSGCADPLTTETDENEKRVGPASDGDLIKLRPEEKKKVVWRDQLYLAPLTTLGNLPFRRICRRLGADITCGEMAMAKCLLQANPGEWALIKRHSSESVFGVQLCGSNPDIMVKCSELLAEVAEVDFVDINVGCPIDFVYHQGAGSGLMRRAGALELMVRGMSAVLPCPLTVKIRTAIHQREKTAHKIIPHLRSWGADLVTLHGRSREQRYTKSADWDYISECARLADPLPLFGNGDVLNFEDYQTRKTQSGVSGIMIARGALMKPWIFTEIKEQRHWDISSSERFDFLRDFVNNGLEHWGSDAEGVEKTRRFLLEWLSFLYRYIPLGLLERPPQAINQKPPLYVGRNHLETLLASKDANDWIKISEMLLGPVPEDFVFLPKHKANAY